MSPLRWIACVRTVASLSSAFVIPAGIALGDSPTPPVVPPPSQQPSPSLPAPSLLRPSLPAPSPTIASAGASPALFELWGSTLAGDRSLSDYGLTGPDLERFLQGFAAGLDGRPSAVPLRLAYRAVEGFKALRHEKALPEIKKRNRALADTYFAGLQGRPGIIRLPSGLCYEVLVPGRGPGPTRFQTVTVGLTARLATGAVFESTGGQGPMEIELVSFIPGAVEGLAQIGVGGRIRLHIPPELGYSDAEAAGWHIPPGSAVVMDLELLSVRDTPAADIQAVLGPQAPRPPTDFSTGGFDDGQLLATWGWVVAQESGSRSFGLTPAEKAALAHGLSSEIQGLPVAPDVARLRPALDAYLKDSRQKLREAKIRQTLGTVTALFAELDKDPSVVRLPDGLRYQVLTPGSEAHPRPDQRVLVTYTGRLIGGKVFDSSELGPMHVDLGKVIRGWTEGVPHVGKGGSIRLYIPPELGYGDASSGAVPPRSTLIYDIRLLDF